MPSTEYAKVTAILRSECLEKVERALQDLGVSGVSISMVKGWGEYADFFCGDWKSAHVRVEVITGAARVDAIVTAVLRTGGTGNPGDGLVAVTPIARVWRVRTKAVVPPSDL